MDTLTFACAYFGHLLLTLVVVGYVVDADSALGRRLAPLRSVIRLGAFAVVTIHVALVWTVRYGGDPALAVARGVGPAVLFHTCYVAIAALTLSASPSLLVRRVGYAAWFAVSFGGSVGSLRVEDAKIFFVPVAASVVFGLVVFARVALAKRRAA